MQLLATSRLQRFFASLRMTRKFARCKSFRRNGFGGDLRSRKNSLQGALTPNRKAVELRVSDEAAALQWWSWKSGLLFDNLVVTTSILKLFQPVEDW
jgi:hypothetical protein